VLHIACFESKAANALALVTFAAVFLIESVGAFGLFFGVLCVVWAIQADVLGAAVSAAGPACTDNLLLSLCLACVMLEL
jgi:hypothetical protein